MNLQRIHEFQIRHPNADKERYKQFALIRKENLKLGICSCKARNPVTR
jgi:hypothetical protein